MRPLSSSLLVANSNNNRWAQAYSTLNLYVAVHLVGEGVAARGKELLDQVTREYFALDEKDLRSIKEIVERVVNDIDPTFEYSLTLASISDSVVYIVAASCGKAALLRGDSYGLVAEGVKGDVTSFSGKLNSEDVLVVGTCDFFEKVGEELGNLETRDINEISEQIAPLMHSESTGGEAAVIIKFSGEKNGEAVPVEENEEAETFDEAEEMHEEMVGKLALAESFVAKYSQSAFKLIKGQRRQSAIIAAIVVLVFSLLFLLLRDRSDGDNIKGVIPQGVKTQVEELISDAEAVAEFEPTRAIDNLLEAERAVLSSMENFERGSDEYKALDSLLGDIRLRLSELEGGESIVLEEYFVNEDFSSPLVTYGKNGVFVISEGRIARISSDGEIEDEENIGDGETDLYALEDFVYVLTDEGVVKVDGGNLEFENVTETEGVDISAFGSNIYVLSGDDILKTGGGEGLSYFEDSSPLSGATSFAIDGAIYVFDRGIEKYLRGTQEKFAITGLVTPLGDDIQLYTNATLDDLYVMDIQNERMVVLSKNGEYVTQYRNNGLSHATSFAIEGDRVYVSTDNGIFTFEM